MRRLRLAVAFVALCAALDAMLAFAAQNFREDNEMFAEALAAVKTYARMTDDEAEAILKNCIWEED